MHAMCVQIEFVFSSKYSQMIFLFNFNKNKSYILDSYPESMEIRQSSGSGWDGTKSNVLLITLQMYICFL